MRDYFKFMRLCACTRYSWSVLRRKQQSLNTPPWESAPSECHPGLKEELHATKRLPSLWIKEWPPPWWLAISEYCIQDTSAQDFGSDIRWAPLFNPSANFYLSHARDAGAAATGLFGSRMRSVIGRRLHELTAFQSWWQQRSCKVSFWDKSAKKLQ